MNARGAYRRAGAADRVRWPGDRRSAREHDGQLLGFGAGVALCQFRRAHRPLCRGAQFRRPGGSADRHQRRVRRAVGARAKACDGPEATTTRRVDDTASPMPEIHRPERLATRAASSRSVGGIIQASRAALSCYTRAASSESAATPSGYGHSSQRRVQCGQFHRPIRIANKTRNRDRRRPTEE